MVEPIITPPRCKYNPLFTFCEFCVAKSARMVFDSFTPFSTGRWWKLWKTKPCTACFFAVFPFLTQENSRVFHGFHGVFNISTVDNPYTRRITFPEYTECERCVKLYRQKKLDAINSLYNRGIIGVQLLARSRPAIWHFRLAAVGGGVLDAPGRPTKNGPIVRKAVKAQFSFRCMTNITRLNTSINTATAAAV